MNFKILKQNYRNHIVILILLVFVFSILSTQTIFCINHYITLYVPTNDYDKSIIFY